MPPPLPSARQVGDCPPLTGWSSSPFAHAPFMGLAKSPMNGAEVEEGPPTAASRVGVLQRFPSRLRALRDVPPGRGDSRADSMPLRRGYRAALAVS